MNELDLFIEQFHDNRILELLQGSLCTCGNSEREDLAIEDHDVTCNTRKAWFVMDLQEYHYNWSVFDA